MTITWTHSNSTQISMNQGKFNFFSFFSFAMNEKVKTSAAIKLHNFKKATLPNFLTAFDLQTTFINLIFSLIHRTTFNASEDVSFFTNNSPPSSPRPCPISPHRSGSMSSLSMENDFVDFNDFINKDKKPYSPARKRLNMDALATTNQNSPSFKSMTPERHLQNLNTNLSFGLRLSSSGALKRSECSEDSLSPVQNKRYRSENQSPGSSTNHQQPAIRKTVSIMNILTSSSEMLRKNRL